MSLCALSSRLTLILSRLSDAKIPTSEYSIDGLAVTSKDCMRELPLTAGIDKQQLIVSMETSGLNTHSWEDEIYSTWKQEMEAMRN